MRATTRGAAEARLREVNAKFANGGPGTGAAILGKLVHVSGVSTKGSALCVGLKGAHPLLECDDD